jgi:hypothetical protein
MELAGIRQPAEILLLVNAVQDMVGAEVQARIAILPLVVNVVLVLVGKGLASF